MVRWLLEEAVRTVSTYLPLLISGGCVRQLRELYFLRPILLEHTCRLLNGSVPFRSLYSDFAICCLVLPLQRTYIEFQKDSLNLSDIQYRKGVGRRIISFIRIHG